MARDSRPKRPRAIEDDRDMDERTARFAHKTQGGYAVIYAFAAAFVGGNVFGTAGWLVGAENGLIAGSLVGVAVGLAAGVWWGTRR